MNAKTIASLTSLLVLASLAWTPLPTRAAPQISGTWTIERSEKNPSDVYLELRSDDDGMHGHSENGSDINAGLFGGFSIADLGVEGKALAFRLAREAGIFDFKGWTSRGQGVGTFVFSPSAAFDEGLRNRGFAALEPRKQLASAMLDLTLAYIDAIRAGGFHDISFEQLITFRALRVTPESVGELRAAFPGEQLDEHEVVELSALHVTPAYLAELRAAGFKDLSPRKAVELKAMKIDRAYVESLARMGYPNLTAQQIVEMRAMKIDEAYLKHLADHGFHDLPVQKLVEAKAMGI